VDNSASKTTRFRDKVRAAMIHVLGVQDWLMVVSRLGRQKFPISLLREFDGNSLIQWKFFMAKAGKPKKFPVEREKPGMAPRASRASHREPGVDLLGFLMHRSGGNAPPGRRAWRHPKSCRISCCRPIAGAK
jgi:hypothetical protein